jgi:orotate phosphoribosyltransferase
MDEPLALRSRLLELLRERSLKLGRFTLTSGQTSHYYFDSKLTTLHPEGAYLTARLLLEEIRARKVEAQAIGGLTLGADPVVSAVAAVSWAERGRYAPLAAFIVRKEPKKHGTQRYIEGFEAQPGTRVIIVDDVCTTGGSTLKAIAGAEEAGLVVAAVFCVVDREQGGREALARYPFYSLFTARELLDAPAIQSELARLGAV